MMPDPDLITGAEDAASATPPTPPADETDEQKRSRGRPTIAELEARKAELNAREEDIRRRELEVELAAAEANLGLRELEVERRSDAVAAGRLSARTGTVRSEELTEPVRGRRYKGGQDMPNKYHIPPEQIPEGMSYQWNSHSVFGQVQHSTNAFMGMQGWEPVMSTRHPHLCPPGYDGPIIIDGQMLVERPADFTNEALQEELDKARGEVRMKEEQLYGPAPGIANQAPRQRDNGTNEFVKVKKQFERPEAELPRGANYSYETPGQGGPIIE